MQRGTHERFSDFNVNRAKVCKVLQWLRENNVLHEDVIINRSNLNSLLEHSDVTHLLPSLAETGAVPCGEERLEDVPGTGVQHSGVPVALALGQSEDIERHLTGPQKEGPVKWPGIDRVPINEFSEAISVEHFPHCFQKVWLIFIVPRHSPLRHGIRLTLHELPRPKIRKRSPVPLFALQSLMQWQAIALGNHKEILCSTKLQAQKRYSRGDTPHGRTKSHFGKADRVLR